MKVVWKKSLEEANAQDTRVTVSPSPDNARSESVLAVNPLNDLNMVGASKRFTDPAKYGFTLAAYATFDGGTTWTEAALALPASWGGITDPAVGWDDAGNVYLVALPFLPGSGSDLVGAVVGIAIYLSTDGGLTWSAPLLIHSSTGDDKQWVAGDMNPASPHHGHVYAAWDDGSLLRFARTTDHGQSWKGTGSSPAGSSLATDSFSPDVLVADDGTVYILWLTGQSGKQIKMVKSTDGGNSFSAPVVVVDGLTSLRGSLPETAGFPHFPGAKFRVLTMVAGCTGRLGTILVTWADHREGASRVYYRVSKDGGDNWLGPLQGEPLLGSGPATVHQFHPQPACAPDGTLGCAYYEYVSQKGRVDVQIVASFNDGDSFTSPLTVTDQPWDPNVGAPFSHGNSNLTFIGEYFGLDASALGFFPFWTDTRTGMQEIFATRVVVNQYPVIVGGPVLEILFGIINDGGGLGITPSGKPKPVPPWDPLMDIVRGLVIYEVARRVADPLGRRLETEAMGAIAKIAEKEAASGRQ